MHVKKFALLAGLFLFLTAVPRSYANNKDCAHLLADTPPARPLRPQGKRPQHVLIIVLENKSFDQTFGKNSDGPYLRCLAQERGKLLEAYYAIGHWSLDNYIAMVSGQAPNPFTQNDCPYFVDFSELANIPYGDGQVVGAGCVYPPSVKTIANQLEEKHLTWRGYMEGMEHGYKTKDGHMEDTGGNCEHPPINQRDISQKATPDHQYAARHNPFIYFHSIIDDPERCANDTSLEKLGTDLSRSDTTPNLAFITPNLCNDGHDNPCKGASPGEKDGLAAADRFLQQWVPRIMKSPAYRQNGMLIITFDEADLGSDPADYESCCGEKPGPNTIAPGRLGPGGGRIGAVIVSPYVRPGTLDRAPYNHYSLLKSLEVLFDIKEFLGYASQPGLNAFGPDVYDAWR